MNEIGTEVMPTSDTDNAIETPNLRAEFTLPAAKELVGARGQQLIGAFSLSGEILAKAESLAELRMLMRENSPETKYVVHPGPLPSPGES